MALLKTSCQDLRLENEVIHFKYKEPFNWVVELNQSKKSSNLSQVRRRWDSNPQAAFYTATA